MEYQEEYKKLYFDLIIVNKKIKSLERDEEVINYLNGDQNIDNFMVDSYIKLVNNKEELLNELNKYYNRLSNEDVSLNSPMELLNAVYERLREKYPKINKKTLNHYILVALNNMRYKDNTFDRQQSRIRRLNLDCFYSNWYYKVERK